MKVQCVRTKLADFPEGPIRDRLKRVIHYDDYASLDMLEMGKIYEVDCLEWWETDNIWQVYIKKSEYHRISYPSPIDFFDIVCGKINPEWVCRFESGDMGSAFKRMAIPVWANDDNFFERLLDGEDKETKIYCDYVNRLKIRKPTDLEIQILAKLLSVEFPCRDVLRAQLFNVRVQTVDNGFSLELYPDANSPLAEDCSTVPVETEYTDIDGVGVSILLFVIKRLNVFTACSFINIMMALSFRIQKWNR